MPDDDDLLDVTPTSSDGTQATDAPGSSPDQDVTPTSSDGKTEAEHKDLLSAVMSASDAEDDEEPFVPPTAQAADTSKEGTATDPEQQPELTTEELRQYTPRAQDRIRELIAKSKEIHAELEAYRPAAEQYQQIQSYMASNRLSTEDFQLLLGTGSLLRSGDPVKLQTFVDVVKPYIAAVEEALGQRLPEDIQSRVDDGELPDDVAREFALTRYRAAQAESAVRESETARGLEHQYQFKVAVNSAIQGWEDQIKSQDPDFERKRPLVEDAAVRMVTHYGPPQTPAQAVEFAREAYNRVSRSFAPSPSSLRPTRPQPSGGHSATPVAAEPRSLLEAAVLGLQRAG